MLFKVCAVSHTKRYVLLHKNIYLLTVNQTNQSELPVHPRIQLLYSGSIISVEFGDAVAVCARGTPRHNVCEILFTPPAASEYRDRVVLKTTASDRTLGVGVNLSTNHLLVLTASTMMKVFLDLDKIQNFHPEYVP